MQVRCGRCGARYEFAVEEIPEEGYEARCSQCEHEFFVAPPSASGHDDVRAVQAALHTGDEPAKKRPTLDSLFEGDLHGSADGPNPQDAPASFDDEEPDSRAPAGPQASQRHQNRRPNAQQPQPEMHDGADEPGEAPSEPQPPARSRSEHIEHEWAMAPLAPPGEPIAARPPPAARPKSSDEPQGADVSAREAAAAYGRMRRPLHRQGLTPPAPATTQAQRTRSRLFVGLGAALFVAVGVGVGVVQSNSLHTPTQVTPPVRIVRDPSPEARAAFDAGVRELNEDTSESLRRAQAHFRAAVEIDREYTDAWGGVALASWLLGIDARDAELADDEAEKAAINQLTASVQAQGRDASAIHLGSGPQGRSDAATDAALALAASSLRMRAAVHDLDRLRAKLRHESQDAWLDLHAAGAALVHAASLPVQTPLLATTMALWLTDMPEGDALVEQQLATAEQLVGQVVAPERRSWLAGDKDETEPSEHTRAAPWAAWRMFARGRLQARHAEQTPSAAAEAVRALEASLRLDPAFKRGQMALAEALVAAKREREAIAVLHKLVQSAPTHQRARALLARLES